VTKAKLAYNRTIAVIACAHIRNSRKRAVCIAAARKLA
jgi:hypothetical protein